MTVSYRSVLAASIAIFLVAISIKFTEGTVRIINRQPSNALDSLQAQFHTFLGKYKRDVPEEEAAAPSGRAKRDVSSGSCSTNARAEVTYSRLNSTDLVFYISWTPQNERSIVMLTKNPDWMNADSSKLYVSTDRGRSFQRRDLKLPGTNVTANVHRIYEVPGYPNEYVLTELSSHLLFISVDYAATFSTIKVPLVPRTITMNENIGFGHFWFVVDSMDPQRSLFATPNGGYSWQLVARGVERAFWGVARTSLDQSSDLLLLRRARSADAYANVVERVRQLNMLRTERLFEVSSSQRILDFQVVNEYAFAFVVDGVSANRRLFVSYRRRAFLEAELPNADAPRSSLEFVVADATQHTVLLCVHHGNSTSALYASDTEGHRFSLSLSNVVTYSPNVEGANPNLFDDSDRARAFCDVEQVEALPGVFVANTLVRGSLATTIDLEEQTWVTFDKGGSWRPLALMCDNSATSCSLHLALRFMKMSIGSADLLSRANAIGTLVALGQRGASVAARAARLSQVAAQLRNATARGEAEERAALQVAAQLLGYTNATDVQQALLPAVYVSADGASTWHETALRGPFVYAMGDHGGLIVAARQFEPSRSIFYSLNSGTSFCELQLNIPSLRVFEVLTEPGERSTTFLAIASSASPSGPTDGWTMVHVNLTHIFDRVCEPADYREWAPGDVAQRQVGCLLGTRTVYSRREPHAACLNGYDYERVQRVERCLCSRADFECDICYRLNVTTNECVPDAAAATLPDCSLPNATCNGFQHLSVGYRRVADDVCVAGDAHRFDRQPVPCATRQPLNFMLIVNGSALERLDLDSNQRVSLLPSGRYEISLFDLDTFNNRLFWFDGQSNVLLVLALDGSSTPKVVLQERDSAAPNATGVDDDYLVEDMAIDQSNGNAYVTLRSSDGETRVDMIRVVALNASGSHLAVTYRRTVLSTRHRVSSNPTYGWNTIQAVVCINMPRSLQVATKRSYLFWLDYHPPSRSSLVCRTTLDGANTVLIANLSRVIARSLIIDEIEGRVYVLAPSLNTSIISMDFDGMQRRNVYRFDERDENDTRRVVSIGVLKNRLYFAQLETLVASPLAGSGTPETEWLNVLSVAKSTGTGRTLASHQLLSFNASVDLDDADWWPRSPVSIKLYHPTLWQFSVSERPVCYNHGGCPYLCVASMQYSWSRACVCPNDMIAKTTSQWDHNEQCSCSRSETINTATGRCELAGGEKAGVCAIGQFRCTNGHCRDQSLRCDGVDQCGDGSDETDCNLRSKAVCTSSSFSCRDRSRCIPRSWLCDGMADCADRSDEFCTSNTSRISISSQSTTPIAHSDDWIHNWIDWLFPSFGDTASTTYFTCTNGAQVLASDRCDGVRDCSDASDEVGCSPTGTTARVTTISNGRCTSRQFLCANSRCVAAIERCDHEDDCGDGSDELECGWDEPKSTAAPRSTIGPSNGVNSFFCYNSSSYASRYTTLSIAMSSVCDGVTDCPSGEDEVSSLCARTGQSNRCDPTRFFKCERSVECVPLIWVCDGVLQCFDGSDELDCGKDSSSRTPSGPSSIGTKGINVPGLLKCKSDQFRCAADGQCVRMDALCDGVPDCYDFSDELDCWRTLSLRLDIAPDTLFAHNLTASWSPPSTAQLQRAFTLISSGNLHGVSFDAGRTNDVSSLVAALANVSVSSLDVRIRPCITEPSYSSMSWSQVLSTHCAIELANTSTSWTFDQLLPFTVYAIYLDINIYRTPLSSSKIFNDADGGAKATQQPLVTFSVRPIHVRTAADSPTPPEKVDAVVKDDGTVIMVTWRAPRTTNGPLSRYSIYISCTNCPFEFQRVEYLDAPAVSTVIEHLPASYTYSLQMTAWTTLESQRSQSVFVHLVDYDLARLKPEHIDFSIINVPNDQCGVISWVLPSVSDAARGAGVVVEAVEVAVVDMQIDYEQIQNVTAVGASISSSLRICGLAPGSGYELGVRAITNRGFGARGDSVIAFPGGNSPPAIVNITASVNRASTGAILLTWTTKPSISAPAGDASSSPNALHYTVYYGLQPRKLEPTYLFTREIDDMDDTPDEELMLEERRAVVSYGDGKTPETMYFAPIAFALAAKKRDVFLRTFENIAVKQAANVIIDGLLPCRQYFLRTQITGPTGYYYGPLSDLTSAVTPFDAHAAPQNLRASILRGARADRRSALVSWDAACLSPPVYVNYTLTLRMTSSQPFAVQPLSSMFVAMSQTTKQITLETTRNRTISTSIQFERGVLYELTATATTSYVGSIVVSASSNVALLQIDPLDAPVEIAITEKDLFIYEMSWKFPSLDSSIDINSVFFEVWFEPIRGGRKATGSERHKLIEINSTSILIEPVLSVPIGYVYAFSVRYRYTAALQAPFDVPFHQQFYSSYSDPVLLDLLFGANDTSFAGFWDATAHSQFSWDHVTELVRQKPIYFVSVALGIIGLIVIGVISVRCHRQQRARRILAEMRRGAGLPSEPSNSHQDANGNLLQRLRNRFNSGSASSQFTNRRYKRRQLSAQGVRIGNDDDLEVQLLTDTDDAHNEVTQVDDELFTDMGPMQGSLVQISSENEPPQPDADADDQMIAAV